MLGQKEARRLSAWCLAVILCGTSALAAVSTPSPAALLQQSESLETTAPEKSLALAQQAREASGTELDRLRADARIAHLQRALTNYPAAIDLATRGLQRARELGDLELQARFHYVLGRAAWNLGDYPSSTEDYVAAIKAAEAANSPLVAFDAHLGFTSLFVDLKQPAQALFHIEQARAIAERLQDKIRLGDLHKVSGNNALAQRNYDLARQEQELSLRLHREAGSERGVADAYQNLGYVIEQQGDLATALSQTRESIALYQKLGLPRQLINAQRQQGRLLVKLGRVDEGIAELEQVLKMSQDLKLRSAIVSAYRELARAHEARGDLKAAYGWQQKLMAENEAVLSERARNQLLFLSSRYQTERRQHEIDLLRRDQLAKDAELAYVRDQRIGLIALLGLGAVALAALISRQRIKRRAAQRVLAEATAARQAAEHADALKTRLVGMVSHDIRGPIGNILAMGEELRDDPAAPRGDTRVQVIVHEARHVLGLAGDLLDSAALEAGRLQLQSAPVDLAQVAQTALDRVALRAEAKGQTLRLLPPAGPDSVIQGDRDRLIQATTNLVSNAVKYSPRHSTIQLSVARRPGRVCLAVQDEGPGIPPESVPLLFRPFSRLPSQATGGESSHGLGLSIAHELVRLHGGEILVEPAPTRGSIFTISLPSA